MSGLEEPVLSRLGRLDNILKQLEDIRESVNYNSPKSSYASATSSGTLTSDGHPCSFGPDFGIGTRCRPVDEVMLEVVRKGTLIDRLVHAEDRILKLCLQFEEEYEGEREKEVKSKSSPKKGLKQLVKSCVRRSKLKTDPHV